MTRNRQALVLDFGGPVLVTPFELVPSAERRFGLAPGTLGWTGPFGDGDADWLRVLAGQLAERAYWAQRAAEFARLTGRGADTRDLIAALYNDEPEDVLVRAGALDLIIDARAADMPVGVLTNDLRAFHSDAWVDALQVLDLIDVVVDGSVEGVLKPHPSIYRLVADRLDVDAADVVFLDDQPVNVSGANAVGMTAVAVDVTAPEEAFARARILLGLRPLTSIRRAG